MSGARLPWVTLGVSVLALALHAGAWAEALELSRAGLAAGELFRLATGHIVHWSHAHLVWDVATLLGLGALCELHSRRQLVSALALAGLAIPLAVLGLRPELAVYRGLSGIDVALFALLSAQLGGRLGCGLALLLAGKLGWELATGAALFVATPPASVVLVPEAHVAGAVAVALYIGCSRLCRRWPAHASPQGDVIYQPIEIIEVRT